MGKILTFTGASGAGKDTLARSLGFPYVTSTTTRQQRATDRPREYEQVSHEEFDRLIKRDAFAWWQPFADEFYGTKVKYLKAAQEALYTSVMILIPGRVRDLREFVPANSITSFYILSPDSAELRARLEKRGDPAEKIERRLQESKTWDEEAERSKIPYVFITNNGTIEEAVEQVRRHLK